MDVCGEMIEHLQFVDSIWCHGSVGMKKLVVWRSRVRTSSARWYIWCCCGDIVKDVRGSESNCEQDSRKM